MTNDWQQIKRAALTRNFQQIPLDNVIVTAAVGMFHQGNIQGLETQHQLVRDLRPTDLEHFETPSSTRASSTPSTPIPSANASIPSPHSGVTPPDHHRSQGPGNRTPHRGIAHRKRAPSPPPSAPCKTRPFPGQISPSQGVIGPPSSGPSQGA